MFTFSIKTKNPKAEDSNFGISNLQPKTKTTQT